MNGKAMRHLLKYIYIILRVQTHTVEFTKHFCFVNYLRILIYNYSYVICNVIFLQCATLDVNLNLIPFSSSLPSILKKGMPLLFPHIYFMLVFNLDGDAHDHPTRPSCRNAQLPLTLTPAFLRPGSLKGAGVIIITPIIASSEYHIFGAHVTIL